jgi:hypothetical protein
MGAPRDPETRMMASRKKQLRYNSKAPYKVFQNLEGLIKGPWLATSRLFFGIMKP